MKRTLLDLTQDILSSLDSDEVNSINDTTEAKQVATLVKTTYDDIVSRTGLIGTKSLFELEASGDPSKPTIMYRPESVLTIEWIKYNKYQIDGPNPFFDHVKFLPLDDFVGRMYNLSTNNPNVNVYTHIVNGSDIEILFVNDKHPEFYTSFDDRTILFDSYYSLYDTTLQRDKSLAYGEKDFSFIMSDDFVPELDADNFTLLYNEAKSLAWAELKQTSHQKAEQVAKRGWARLQKNARRVITNGSQLTRLPNYGRKVR